MEAFKDFESQDFMTQIGILRDIEENGRVEAVSSLYAMVNDPLADEAVNTMIRKTLRQLLLGNEELVVKGLASDRPAERNICLRALTEQPTPAAAPALLELAEKETDPDALLDILGAMASVRAPEFLPVFRENLHSPYTLIADAAVRMIGAYRDKESLQELMNFVTLNEDDVSYQFCDITTWSAVESMAAIGGDDVVAFLATKIHHRNPTARRIIHKALTAKGVDAVPAVIERLADGDPDERIMAANVLGLIGSASGKDVLLDVLNDPAAVANLAFAVYEALGNIPDKDAVGALLTGIGREGDEAMLLAVVGALEKQLAAGAAVDSTALIDLINMGDAGLRRRMVTAVVSAKADNLFAMLYADSSLAVELVEKVVGAGDAETSALFRKALESMEGDQASSDMDRLAKANVEERVFRLLAVDDSEAMLNFYRGAGRELGLEVVVAANGLEGWQTLQNGDTFDLLVVDMNMPEMDGIEFTGKVRSNPAFVQTPIIMATTESSKSQAALAKKAGVNDFLVKPFKADVLQHKIAKLLEKDRSG